MPRLPLAGVLFLVVVPGRSRGLGSQRGVAAFDRTCSGVESATATGSLAGKLIEGFEPWRDKRGIAAHFACSVRWIERRMEEGMPHRHITGRAKFRVSEAEPWLEAHGQNEPRGEVGP